MPLELLESEKDHRSKQSTHLVNFENLTVVKGREVVLENISWNVKRCEHWVVLGPNGSGKTTLLSCVYGETYPTHGVIKLFGSKLGQIDVRDIRRKIGRLSPLLRFRVRPTMLVIELCAAIKAGLLDSNWITTGVNTSHLVNFLDEWGLGNLVNRCLDSLSSGEFHKLELALALIEKPELLVLDEPFAFLDLSTRQQSLQIVNSLQERSDFPNSTVLVTHYLDEIPSSTTHALLLRGGQIVKAGPISQVITTEHVSACFGVPLKITRNNGRYIVEFDEYQSHNQGHVRA